MIIDKQDVQWLIHKAFVALYHGRTEPTADTRLAAFMAMFPYYLDDPRAAEVRMRLGLKDYFEAFPESNFAKLCRDILSDDMERFIGVSGPKRADTSHGDYG